MVIQEDINKKSTSFKSPDYLAKWLFIFLIGEIALTFISSITSASEALGRESSYYWQVITDSVNTTVSLGAIALFIIWFIRVYHNLQALGVKGLKYSTKRMIISFFIPVLNLFEPAKGMKELWKASEPSADVSNDYSWKELTVPAGLGIWWFLAVATRFHEVQFFGTGTEYLQLVWEIVVVPISVLIVNIVTIIIIRQIDSRQEKKKISLSMHKQ